MRCIIVDNSMEDIEHLKALCMQIEDTIVENVFTSPLDALDYLRLHQVDVVFSGQHMGEMSGLEFARNIHAHDPSIGIIFVTKVERFAIASYEVDAKGYIIKPATVDKVRRALERVKQSRRCCLSAPSITVHTFGHFDIYVNGVAVVFKSKRAKELMAILVDRRGGMVTMEQVIEAFWPEEPISQQHKALYRKAVAGLKKTLEEYNILSILISRRSQLALVSSAVDCDYYRMLNGDAGAIKSYDGEYMVEYSWAEDTNGRLYRLAKDFKDEMLKRI